MKRSIRRISVVLRRKWKNTKGFDVAITLGAIVICCTILSVYFGMVLRDPMVPASIKLYWGAFVGSIFLFFLYGATLA